MTERPGHKRDCLYKDKITCYKSYIKKNSGSHFHNVLCLSEAKGMDITMDIALMEKGLYTQEEWFHEILSFVILLCNTVGGKTTIYKNPNSLYCADIDSGTLQFNEGDTLYSAFIWFHLHTEEYGEAFADAYKKNNMRITFAHTYSVNYMWLKKTALFEIPKVCLKKSEFPLSPSVFYKLLFKAHSLYHPDLFILDLRTDIESHKKARERLMINIALHQ